MIRAIRIVITTCGFALAVMPLSASPFAEPLTVLEARGKRIYLEGRDPRSGKILATVGKSGIGLPAIMLPCANCHGSDGLGREEGGVRPPNITWAELTKPYGHRHPDGRSHPAFDEMSFGRAVTGAVDPAGNPLNPAMPRYEMADPSIDALAAYMKRLSVDLDPGLSATAIRIAMASPTAGPLAPVGRAATATIRAYFDDVNVTGGIFGRRIEFSILDRARDTGPTLVNAQRLAERRRAFALVNLFGAGADSLPSVDAESMPQVGAFKPLSGGSAPLGGDAFFLLSGLSEQARALVGYAARKLDLSAPRVTLILPGDNAYPGLAGAVESEARKRGWPTPGIVHLSDGQAISRHVNALKRMEIEAVFYFAAIRGLAAFAAAAAEIDWMPYLLLSGAHAGRAVFDVPSAFGDKLFLAYPSVPSDKTALVSIEFEDLRRRHGIPPQYPAARAVAYAVAKVLVEGLRRSGKALSRARFIAALKGLTDFETGVTPLISFGSNRRVGALGAYILGVDLKNRRYRPGAVWVPL